VSAAQAVTPAGLRVTQLRQDDDGVWHARVHLAGLHVDVDRRFGSWQAVFPDSRGGGMIRRDVKPATAAALQARLPASERKPPSRRVKEEAR
jgi:hypothetical protein